MKNELPLSLSEALTLAKEAVADEPAFRTSDDAKIAFTILLWFIARTYQKGYELVPQRGEAPDKPGTTGPRIVAGTWPPT